MSTKNVTPENSSIETAEKSCSSSVETVVQSGKSSIETAGKNVVKSGGISSGGQLSDEDRLLLLLLQLGLESGGKSRDSSIEAAAQIAQKSGESLAKAAEKSIVKSSGTSDRSCKSGGISRDSSVQTTQKSGKSFAKTTEKSIVKSSGKSDRSCKSGGTPRDSSIQTAAKSGESFTKTRETSIVKSSGKSDRSYKSGKSGGIPRDVSIKTAQKSGESSIKTREKSIVKSSGKSGRSSGKSGGKYNKSGKSGGRETLEMGDDLPLNTAGLFRSFFAEMSGDSSPETVEMSDSSLETLEMSDLSLATLETGGDSSIEGTEKNSDNDNVRVFIHGRFLSRSRFTGFEPTGKNAAIQGVGLMFYPGALVKPKQYFPIARSFAQLGYHVAVAHFPSRSAIRHHRLADDLVDYKPWKDVVKSWIIAGHSLGGGCTRSSMKMREMYAANHANEGEQSSLPQEECNTGGPIVRTATGLKVRSSWATKDDLTTEDKMNAGAEMFSIEAILQQHDSLGWTPVA